MLTRTLFAMTLAAALFATGCAKKEEPKEEPKVEAAPAIDLAAEEQAIRNRSGEWMNYANSKDAASIATKMFASDGLLVADDKAYKGQAAIQAKMEEDIKKNPNGLVSWTSDQVRVSSAGDFAVETGSLHVRSGRRRQEVCGQWLVRNDLDQGRWRVAGRFGCGRRERGGTSALRLRPPQFEFKRSDRIARAPSRARAIRRGRPLRQLDRRRRRLRDARRACD